MIFSPFMSIFFLTFCSTNDKISVGGSFEGGLSETQIPTST